MFFLDDLLLPIIVLSKRNYKSQSQLDMKNISLKLLTCLTFFLIGGSVMLKGQCNASFQYSSNANTFSFSTAVGGFTAPVFTWVIEDNNNNTTHTLSGAALTYNFSGPASSGYHYACLTVVDTITGCQATYCDTLFTGNINNPCAAFAANYQYYPSGNNVYFSTYGITGGTSPYTYAWNFAGLGSSTVANPSFTFPSIGSYVVDLVITDALGCQFVKSDTVQVNAPCGGLAVSYSYTTNGNTASFSSNITGGFNAGPYNYAWNFHGLGTSNAMNPSFTYPGAGWYATDLTIYDTLGCQTTYHDSVYIAGSPCSNITVDYQYTTSGNSISFNSNVSGFFPPFTQYSWDFGNGTYSYTANPTTQLSTGWHFVCLTVTDSFCTDTYCDSIYVNNGTNPCNTNVSFFDSIRVGNDITFHASSYGFDPGFTLYSWDFGNGTYGAGISPTVNLSNGWHYVCLTVTDSICTTTYCDSIYVNNGTNPCAQNSVTLNLLFDNYATETSWTVTNANGTVVANGGNYSSAMNGQNLPIDLCLPTGCYNFNIYDSYGDGICCLYGNGNYSLVEDATGAILTSGGSFAYAETTNFCVGGASNPCGNFGNGSFTYSVGANGVVTFTPVLASNQYPLNFVWDFGNGNVSSSSNPTFTFANGYHLVCVTADSGNCSFTYCDTIMVTTNNGNPTGPCANLTTDINITQSINDPFLLWMQPVINGAAANAAFTFVWDFGDNTGAMSGAPLHTYNSFGSYVVCLMALDTMNGCVSTFCDTITVDSSGNFSRNATKPGFTINMLPPVINYYTATDKVEENAMTINLFPNPANHVVNLAISSEEAINGTVSILDVTGKVAYMNNLNVAAGQEQVSLPVDQLPSGVYLVRITSETTQQTMKFIKE